MLVTERLILDPKTGAVTKETFKQVAPRTKLNKDFGMCGQEGLDKLLSLQMSGGEWNVLVSICRHCEWNNAAYVTRKQLAGYAGLSRISVWRALEALIRWDLVRGDVTDENRYFVDPLIWWKGKSEHRPAAIRKWSQGFTSFPDETESAPLGPQGTLT